ncbi:hypothetical protein [Streptomyces sp. NBC_00872]|uniref:hypothetical protein n=1 Tax=Streptomyces sp. NBC_00872 TaxID=2903686 RepID=UPI0038677557|nr:hypothetical protein OG214_14215 [Streptomyces sp. NBC_00872]
MRTRTADMPVMSRRVILAATAAALALGLTGACGGGKQSDGETSRKDADAKAAATATAPATPTGEPSEEPSPRPGLTGIGASDGRVLGQDELDRAVLTEGDVSGFTVERMAAPPPQGETAGKAECLPLTAVINGKPEPLGKAVAYRQLVGSRNGRPAVSEFLTAHGGQGAGTVLSRLRTAVTACADGFTATGGDSPSKYTGVKLLPPVEVGDDALAYQVTGDFEGEPVPLVFHVVRVGGTVATFYTANLEDARTPRMPAALLQAQATKLK